MMNSRKCADVQALILDLDNTHVTLARLRPLLIRPHLRFLVGRIADLQIVIGDALAAQMGRAGVRSARRGGGVPARIRAKVESWIAISNVDIEVGCLNRVIHHGTRVARRFRVVLGKLPRLNQNLHRELFQLERDLFRIESLMQEMEMPRRVVPPSQLPAAAAARLSPRERSRA